MSLHERMLAYEIKDRLEKGAVIIRVDGRAFHTWTKKIKAHKPFDSDIMKAMRNTTRQVSDDMQSCLLAYTQSDEASFLLANPEEKTQGWFDYKLQKMVSMASSLFTAYFNHYIGNNIDINWPEELAFFDARAFSIPLEDAANYFVYRQQDWMRNSVSMLFRSEYSHKESLGLNVEQQKEKLASEKSIFWNELSCAKKYGTFIKKEAFHSQKLKYDEINYLAGIDESTYQFN